MWSKKTLKSGPPASGGCLTKCDEVGMAVLPVLVQDPREGIWLRAYWQGQWDSSRPGCPMMRLVEMEQRPTDLQGWFLKDKPHWLLCELKGKQDMGMRAWCVYVFCDVLQRSAV